jgi:glycosyltransferase involved in cell wall biosynthesis
MQTLREIEVIVVDNNSTDQTVAILDQFSGLSNFRLILSNQNLGFSGGVNRGLEQASGEFIALLNPDAVVDDKWLETMVHSIKQSESYGMCACLVYFMNGEEGTVENAGAVICSDGLGIPRGRLQSDSLFKDPCEVLCPIGSAGMYKKEMLVALDGFDEEFFLFQEDIDLGLRAQMLGYRCIYSPEAKVYHHFSKSTGLISRQKVYYMERNRLWLIIKNFHCVLLFASIPITIYRFLCQAFGILVNRGPAALFCQTDTPFVIVGLLLKGYLSTFKKIFSLLSKRRKIDRNRKVSLKDQLSILKKHYVSPRKIALAQLFPSKLSSIAIEKIARPAESSADNVHWSRPDLTTDVPPGVCRKML